LEGSASYRELTDTEVAKPAPSEKALAPLPAPESASVGYKALKATKSVTRPVIKQQPVESHTVYLKDTRTFWQRHPMVKGAAIGGGVGAGAGALTGLISGQGILRGAVIGAGTGAGVGVIRTSKLMKRHPIARDVATGAASGLGVGWAGSRRPGVALAGTGIGAAIGLGTGLFTQLR
jgi:hypothetical protein